MALRNISLEELAKHRSSDSCYVTLGNKVYDITPFLNDHPGGDEIILEYAGKDITSILQDLDSHQHSESAYEVLEDHLIGILPPGESARGTALPPSPPTTPEGIAPESSLSAGKSFSGMTHEDELSRPTDIAEDYRKHKFLDLSKPLFMQVWRGNFSKEFYLDQVHRPRHVKGGASAPFFGNFLEPLSKTPWYVVPMVWVPLVTYGVYLSSQGLAPQYVAAAFVLGLCLWTLVEYVLHRCLFHVDEKMPDHRICILLHFTMHGVHHYLPMDRLRLVMPPALFLVLASPWWKLAHFIFRDWYFSTAVYCGGVFGYVCYDLTHYFLHHKNLPSYYKQLKKYHLQHHFADYQAGFGVTSPFWDKVFGTELKYTYTKTD